MEFWNLRPFCHSEEQILSIFKTKKGVFLPRRGRTLKITTIRARSAA